MQWHRSFYWRIALGAVAFLGAMLVVQAMLFVWVVSQSGRNLPGQSPARLGMTVALDLANLLERDPQADLAPYVKDQYAQYAHPFFVMMADGRLITSGSRPFPEPLLAMARARLQRAEGGGRGERGERGGRFERFERGGDRFERDPSGLRFVRPSPIVVDGRLAGVVVVPPQAPFGFLLGRYGPMLALVAAGVLFLGAVLTSAPDFRSGAPPAARARGGGAQARRRRSVGARARSRRRRNRRRRQRVQRHGRRPGRARRRAGRVGSRSAASCSPTCRTS